MKRRLEDKHEETVGLVWVRLLEGWKGIVGVGEVVEHCGGTEEVGGSGGALW